jgi:hypothetical protein
VASIGTSNIKDKELDSPLAWVRVWYSRGSIPTTGAAAAAAEGVERAEERDDGQTPWRIFFRVDPYTNSRTFVQNGDFFALSHSFVIIVNFSRHMYQVL